MSEGVRLERFVLLIIVLGCVLLCVGSWNVGWIALCDS